MAPRTITARRRAVQAIVAASMDRTDEYNTDEGWPTLQDYLTNLRNHLTDIVEDGDD